MSARQVVVKKIRPYPFDARIGREGQANLTTVHILKITPIGFIAKVEKDMFVVGEHHNVEFVLPTYADKILEPIKVIKTYDSMEKGDAGIGKTYMAEFHFTQFKAHTKALISGFMKHIGQTK